MEKKIRYLEERVRYLEEVNRFAVDALELALSVGDFQPSINKLQETSVLLDETKSRIERLIQFEAVAFYLVDGETNDFTLAKTEPRCHASTIADEVGFLIHNQTFAWALNEKRPVFVPSKNQDRQLILHAMATSSRIRGMFVGLLEKGKEIYDLSLSLLSIILLNSANALESFELYKMIKGINEALEKEKESYRILFEAAPDGVEVLDRQGNILNCNKTFEHLVEYGHEEIVGRHTSHFFSNGSKALFQGMLSTVRREGHFESETELVRKDGSIIPVWRKERAIYDEEKEFVGVLVYNHDISSVKQAEEEKKNLEAQLARSQKMEALGLLAGGVAHDLNNILVGLVSYPELLLMNLPKESPLRNSILTIQRSGQRAAAIVQDLLTLARRGVSVTEVVNLNKIITDQLISLEYESLSREHPDVTFHVCLEEGVFDIMGSPVHLSKSIMNLLSNAAEAMPGGGKATISTENLRIDQPMTGYDHIQPGEFVLLTVSDTGAGIPSTEIERIFEPFYTRKVMGRSGTGLGLAVVWGTVRDHGGYIEVESAEGKGSAFRLYFPITKNTVCGGASGEFDIHTQNAEKILIVDDEKEQRDILCEMLTAMGYAVSTVASGEEAVEYLKRQSADLLILDMIMGSGIDGLETYRRILDVHRGQKAILVSGFSETEQVRDAQKLGAGAYVKKPFLLKTLGMAVKGELKK